MDIIEVLPFPLSCGIYSDYAHGITMMSPFTSEKKQLVSFCSPSGEELRKFAEELREAIAEVNEMEQIHIQCKDTSTLLSLHGHLIKTMARRKALTAVFACFAL